MAKHSATPNASRTCPTALALIALGFLGAFTWLVWQAIRIPLLTFLGYLVEELRSRQAGAWTWVALGSALMFTTCLNVALGLDAAAVLLHGDVGAETVQALHSAAFLLAAPATGAGVPAVPARPAVGREQRRAAGGEEQ